MKRDPEKRILFLCYGNPARLDDGLGPAFGEAMEKIAPPGVNVEADYQLMLEDVKTASEHDLVIFVDASVSGDLPFSLRPVRPRGTLTFSSHSLEPEHVLSLAEGLFGRKPEGYAFGIRGYVFDDFGEQLSTDAQTNLASALQFMLTVLERGDVAQASAALACSAGGRAAGNGD
jgi:hydrogenase maturation protease